MNVASVPPVVSVPPLPPAEAGELAHPCDDAVLEHRADRRHLEHGDRLIQRGGDGLHPDRRGQRSGDLMPDVARMIEMIAVGKTSDANARNDRIDRLSVARDRFVESRGESGGRVLRRDAAGAVSRLHEVVGREPTNARATAASRVGLDPRREFQAEWCDGVRDIGHSVRSMKCR